MYPLVITAVRLRSPISTLAVELISEILAMASGYEDGYTDAAEGNRSHRWSPLVILGKVCKHWREIILGTPKLWTTLIVNPTKDFKYIDLIQERIFCSGGLPISLVVRHQRSSSVPMEDMQPLLDLIKACSMRWNQLFLHEVDYDVFYELFKNLKDTPRLENFRIVRGSLWQRIPMFQPLRPYRFEAHRISAPFIHFHDLNFLQWDNLRHLTVNEINTELVLHIVNHAVNLETTVIKSTAFNTFPFDIYGIVTTLPNEWKIIHNSSVKNLDMSLLGVKDAFQHLSFPSLETLVCRLDPKGKWEYDFYTEETDLVAFFSRSQAITIQDVMLDLHICNGMTLLGHDPSGQWGNRGPSIWNSQYPPLTHLRISADSFKTSPKTIDHILRELTYGLTSNDYVLFPSLRTLEIHLIYFMTPDRWTSFIDIFPPSISYHATEESPLMTPVQRSLSKVTMKLVKKDEVMRSLVNEGDLMRRDQFLRLMDIQKSGVELQLIGRDGEDLLVYAGRMYGSDLVGDEERFERTEK